MNCTFLASNVTARLRSSIAPRHSRVRRVVRFAFSLALLFWMILPSGLLHAQTVYGSIAGVVKDPTGAVVPGVAVTVHESSTATEYKTVTNKSGSYRVSFLKPSSYVVHFEKDGFAQYATNELNIVLNQDVVVDVAMKPGTTEAVTVTDVASSLNDTNPQVGGQFSNSELVDLPESTSTKGANEFLITKAFAGISSTSQDYSNVNNASFGGGRPVTNPIIIDGLPSNMGVDGTYGLIPTPDSTEELQVLTAPFSAQYGQSGGGALLTTTKSGTDHYHGTAFEQYNSQKLTALNPFYVAGTPVLPSYFNYFGGSIGGPVSLPKLFDGRKHKLYFFEDLEDTLTHSANSPLNTNVPTTAELGGDFSGPWYLGGPSPTIYDPATTTITGKTVTRTPFQSNMIPKQRLDQIGLNLASYFPQPNCDPTTNLSKSNYCLTPLSLSSYLYDATRLDYNASDYDHIWAKFSRDGPRNQAVTEIPNAANNSAFNGWTDDHYEVSWSHIFSPHISNEARVGYVSEVNFSYPVTSSVGSLGLQGVPLTQFPKVTTSQLIGFGAGSFSQTRDGHYIVNDAMILQMGRQTLSIGGELMRYAYSYDSPGILSGQYTFNGMFTSVPGQTGSGLPDLLLGLPSTTAISTTNTIFHLNLNYLAGYVQDDIRLTTRLTINLGLRYEFDGPFSEIHNNMYTFNPNIMDPATQKQGGIQFAGYNGAPHSLIANVYTGILPRAGFNYRLFRNTVVRGGYGIYELPSIGFGTVGLTSKSTVNVSFPSPDGYHPAYELNQGVPAYSPSVDANGNPLIPTSLTKPSYSPVELPLTAVLPYLQEWQFGVQQDLGHNWVGEIDYEGNHGVHQPVELPINQIAPTGNCCFGVSDPQALRPYPQFLTVTHLTNDGASAYAALLASLSHRWSKGVSVRASYTWAHGLDDVDAPSRADAVAVQNYYNLHAQWGTSMINIPQRFSLSTDYALPVGSGGKLLNHTPVLSQAIGHWKVTTLAQFQIGYPYNISQGSGVDTLNLFEGQQYVTEVGNPNIPRGQRTAANWFNTKAFVPTPADTFGNAPRATLYGPGQNVWDMSLMRDIPVRERMRVTLRVDAHNAFNHPQYSGLGTSLNTPKTFGTLTGAEDPRMVLLIGRLAF